MNRKLFLAMLFAVAACIGFPYQSDATCLMDCEEVIYEAEGQEGNGEDTRADEARRDQRTPQFGDIRESMILNGVVMKSTNNVSVGTNSGDINTNSTNVIQGINKSHNNTSNTTTTSNR